MAEAPKTTKPPYPKREESLITHPEKDGPSEYRALNLDDVVPPPHLLRQTVQQAPLAELAADIQLHGQLTPILVRSRSDGKYELIAGLRRCMALDALGETTVNAIIRTADDADAAFLALVENLKRNDVNPVDEGQYFHTLLQQHGLTTKHIAESIGKSASYIDSRLSIALWPEYLRTALLNSILNLSQCTEIARGKAPNIQQQLYQWTLEMGANTKKISAWRKELETRIQDHVASGATPQSYQPPDQPVIPRFDCPACNAVTTIDHQSILSVCDQCYEALITVINQGHLRPAPPPPGGTQ